MQTGLMDRGIARCGFPARLTPRAYARYDAERLEAAMGPKAQPAGTARQRIPFAMTVDSGRPAKATASSSVMALLEEAACIPPVSTDPD